MNASALEHDVSSAPVQGRGRIARAVMTWTSGAAYTAVTLLVGLVATPAIVGFIGEARFGAFRAVSDWMGYLLLADLGLGTAFGVALVRANAAGPAQRAAIVRQALRVLGRMTLLAIPLALALAWFMPHLLREGWELGPELRASAAVTALGLAFGPLLIFRSHLDASQRGYLVNIALLVQSLVVTALSVLLAWQGFGLVGQSLAALAGLAAFTILIVVWSRPLLKAAARTPQAEATGLKPARLWSLSWPLATAAAGNRLNLMTDTIVIGKLLGAGDVAMLFLTQRIILLCAGQVNGLANSSWAALAELRQSGQTRAFETRLAELTRLIVGAGLVIVGSVAAFNRQFVALWVGPHLYGGDLLCAATLGSVVTFGFLLPYAWAIDMAGDTRHRLVASSIGSALNVAFSVTFVLWFGIAGVALGTLCAYLLTDAWYCPWLVARRYGIRGWSIVESAGRGLLVGLPWVAAVWVFARAQGTPDGWLEFLAETTVVGALALLYCWALILNRDDRTLWTRRVRAAFA